MHPFYDYLCEHLGDLLKKRSVVVFYDPRREFWPFFDRELALEDSDVLPRVTLCGCKPFLARFDGEGLVQWFAQLGSAAADTVWSVAVDGTVAYLACGSGGLKVISVSDPSNPQEIGSASISGYVTDVAVQVRWRGNSRTRSAARPRASA